MLESAVGIGQLGGLGIGLALGVHGDGSDLLLLNGAILHTGSGLCDGIYHIHAGSDLTNGIKNDLKHKRGVLSMARSSSPNSAGSQFFIMHQDAKHLDGQYAAFGKVTSGMDVVDAIAKCKTGRNDRPVEEQKIASITVERNGAELAQLNKLPDPYGRF